MINEIISKIGCHAWTAITYMAGLITMYFFDLYKNKISKLQYSISKSSLGQSGQDDYFGKVQVIYNDNPVENLYLCNINLVNTSNKDFKDIEITVWCNIDSIILASSARKAGTINVLLLTHAYMEDWKNTGEHNIKLLNSRRPYAIPVLNRDDSVSFTCIVSNPNKAEPHIYLDCDHPGLKIEPTFIKPQLFWGENQSVAALYGLFITAAISIFITYYFQSKVIVVPVVFSLAAFLLIPGVVALKIFKKIKKLIR